MGQVDYNLLFRWFVGLNMDDPIWDVIVEAFFDEVLAQARAPQLLSNEHFTVDGTPNQAWAGLKSFQRKDVARVALLRQHTASRRARVGWMFLFGLTADNMVHIRNLRWTPV